MRLKNYIVLDKDGGYPFGVIARSRPADELHGPFHSRLSAWDYIEALKREFSDYDSFDIVKIELPAAPYIVQS